MTKFLMLDFVFFMFFFFKCCFANCEGADNGTYRSGIDFFAKLDMIEKSSKQKAPKKRARKNNDNEEEE
jgi:hypothetical protein